MENIQIFEPEIKSFSVTLQFSSESTFQSGSMMVNKWINYFISLRTLLPENSEDYTRCISILRYAAFCEGTAASLTHFSDSDGKKKIEITLYFDSLKDLTKFIENIKEFQWLI